LTRILLSLAICASALAQDGVILFEKHCSSCHQPGSETRAPLRAAMAQLTRQAILASLETGSMKAQGQALTTAERRTLAEYLTERTEAETKTQAGLCTSPPAPLRDLSGWNGWGADFDNSRFQPAKLAGLSREQVTRLKLKWAFGFAGATTTYGPPTIAGGRLFLGSADGTVYSLDARSGCVYWTFKAAATVRSAISLGPFAKGRHAAWFGDMKGNVYAIDADTGALLWKTQVEDHAYARITGAPKLHAGRLYVPVSSVEEVPAGNPKYPCCTFRGSVVALDAASGKQIWKTYMIPDPPKATKLNSAGAQLHGPAGAAVWSSPTLDLKRKAIYVATGNSYSEPTEGHSDAILAIDMDSGSVRWTAQMTSGDGWNFSCANPNRASCPENPGQDLDFGSSPILRSLPGGRSVLLCGQKSGILHALDPDQQGKIVWQTRIGKGGALGGIEWGPAADQETVYVALSDINRREPNAGGGLFALRIATGEKLWYTPPAKLTCVGRAGCNSAQMQAVTLIPGVVFSGSRDGHLRGYDTTDGAILWDFDTLQDYQTVNGVAAKGGSLDAAGPTIAGGILYVNSGYGTLGGMPGNALLAFSVEGK
jgi:polyvinyl alcohol dehydrogenase (cytochrome)